MVSRLLRMAYELRMHKFADTQLDVLIRNLSLFAAAIVLFQWLLRGRPPLPAWHWLVFGLILVLAITLIVLGNWAAHAGYIRFMPQPSLVAPAPLPMDPDDKEAVFASGRFEVEGKQGRLADLMAYWRSFGSREHAVMAIKHPSRFLVGRFPSEQTGMWYIFFRPEDVAEVTAGTIAFGGTERPGLRVTYLSLPPLDGKKPKKPLRETMYLGFEREDARSKVWADLLAGPGLG